MIAVHQKSLNSSVADVEAHYREKSDELIMRDKAEDADLRRRLDEEDANNRDWKNNPDRRHHERLRKQNQLQTKQKERRRALHNEWRSALADARAGKPTVDPHNSTDRQTSGSDQGRRTSSAFDHGNRNTLR